MTTVFDANHNPVDFDATINLMDDDLREELHREMAPCTEQEFFEAYAERHAEKFGGDFAPYVGGAW